MKKTYFGGLATRFKPLQSLLMKAAEHGLSKEASYSE